MVAKVPTVLLQIDENGTPRTINKRVKVHMIASKHIHSKLSVEDVARHYDINVADVYAALAYYHENADYFSEREANLKSLQDDAREYTANLRAKIEARLAGKKSED